MVGWHPNGTADQRFLSADHAYTDDLLQRLALNASVTVLKGSVAQIVRDEQVCSLSTLER